MLRQRSVGTTAAGDADADGDALGEGDVARDGSSAATAATAARAQSATAATKDATENGTRRSMLLSYAVRSFRSAQCAMRRGLLPLRDQRMMVALPVL
jgi:hypothetical protein